jgi:hypothetical protein
MTTPAKTTTTTTTTSPCVTCPICRDPIDPSKIGRYEIATTAPCWYRRLNGNKIDRHKEEEGATTATKQIETSKRGVGDCGCCALARSSSSSSTTTQRTGTTTTNNNQKKKQVPDEYDLNGSDEGAYAMLLHLQEKFHPKYDKVTENVTTANSPTAAAATTATTTTTLDLLAWSSLDYEYETNKDDNDFWGRLEKETFQ